LLGKRKRGKDEDEDDNGLKNFFKKETF
jgi:AdoMet-dependent rRNA methyltransferase SPB1